MFKNAAHRTFRDHGATFMMDGTIVETHKLYGYLVGGVVPTAIVASEGVFELVKDIERFVKQHHQALRGPGVYVNTTYVGAWQHGANVYIDGVDFVGNRTAALELARERGELAIWDCQHGNEIGVA